MVLKIMIVNDSTLKIMIVNDSTLVLRLLLLLLLLLLLSSPWLSEHDKLDCVKECHVWQARVRITESYRCTCSLGRHPPTCYRTRTIQSISI